MKSNVARKALGAASLVLASTVSMQASAGIIDFWFDRDGAGPSAAVYGDQFNINDPSGAGGKNVNVTISPQSLTTYTFTQTADYTISALNNNFLLDGNGTPLFNLDLTGGVGTGTFGGEATFTDGLVQVYNASTLLVVAEFKVTGGGIGVDQAGVPIQNQAATLVATPNFTSTTTGLINGFLPGYFFLNDGGAIGSDFSDLNWNTGELDLDGGFLALGIASTTTNNAVTTENNDGTISVALNSAGQVRFEEQIPAPASLLLLGLGLVSLVRVTRSRS